MKQASGLQSLRSRCADGFIIPFIVLSDFPFIIIIDEYNFNYLIWSCFFITDLDVFLPAPTSGPLAPRLTADYLSARLTTFTLLHFCSSLSSLWSLFISFCMLSYKSKLYTCTITVTHLIYNKEHCLLRNHCVRLLLELF
jgi:hypothetical protein